MEKKQYITPKETVIAFAPEDMLAASGHVEGDGENPGGYDHTTDPSEGENMTVKSQRAWDNQW